MSIFIGRTCLLLNIVCTGLSIYKNETIPFYHHALVFLGWAIFWRINSWE